MEKEKIKKNYEIEGNIPTLYAALSIVKNKLLGPALAKKYPDYVTFLTYHIIEVIPLDAKSQEEMRKQEIGFMDRATLLELIKELALPVDANYYPNLFRLREAVQFAKNDPEGYKKHFALREADLRLDIEMAKCNPDLYPEGGDGLVASVNLQSAAKAKSSSPSALQKKTGDRLSGLAADQMRDGELGPLDNSTVGHELNAGDL